MDGSTASMGPAKGDTRDESALPRVFRSDPLRFREFRGAVDALSTRGQLSEPDLVYLHALQVRLGLDESECVTLVRSRSGGRLPSAVDACDRVENAHREPAAVISPGRPNSITYRDPQLEAGGVLQRLGRGRILEIFPLESGYVVACAGGVVVLDRDGEVVVEIDARVQCCAVTPRGELIALSSRTELQVWSVGDGTASLQVRHSAPHVEALALRPDGLQCAVGEPGKIHLYDLSTGSVSRTLLLRDQVQPSVLYASGGRVLASACKDCVQFWDPHNGWELATHQIDVKDTDYTRICASPDGRVLIVMAPGVCTMWDFTRTLNLVPKALPGPDRIRALSTDGKLLACADGGCVTMLGLDIESPTSVSEIVSPGLSDISLSSDGGQILIVADDREISWHSIDAGTCSHRRDIGTQGVSQSLFSPSTDSLACVYDDGTVVLWDVATGEPRSRITRPGLVAISFNPADGALAVLFQDGELSSYEMNHGPWKSVEVDQGLTSLCFSPDGRYLVTGSREGALQLRDYESGCTLREIDLSLGMVYDVAFSADGSLLACVGDGGRVSLHDPGNRWKTVWRSDAFRNTYLLPPYNRSVCRREYTARFSGGRLLALSSVGGQPRLWDVTNPSAPIEMRHNLYRLHAVSRSGWLAAPTKDGLTIYDPDMTEVSRCHPGHVHLPLGSASCAGFSPDERVIALADGGTVRIWRLDSCQRYPLDLVDLEEIEVPAWIRRGERIRSLGGASLS